MMGETVLFDRYRLVAPAGRGGSAEVWRAIDEESGDEVAVKRLHPVVFADEFGRGRLQREFDALRSVDEPHVVRVRDLRVGDREAILVLDYVDGPSLAGRLAGQSAERPALTPDAACAIVADIAAALTAAHAAGIVHRDVTPGNILLDASGEARLTDFGIAHGSDDAAVTATGLVMGTLRYLAPEQLRGGVSTPSSDLYGLAAVAYELFAGRPAFSPSSPVDLAAAQDAGPAPIERVPPAVDAIVRRSLAVDPTERAADVAAFAASIRAAFADEATVPMAVAPAAAAAAATRPLVAAPASAAVPAVAAARPPVAARGPIAAHHVPAALAAIVGLVLVAALVAAAGRLPIGPFGVGAAPSARPAVHTATPRPTATPQPARNAGAGKGGDHGHGGHDNGNGNEGGD